MFSFTFLFVLNNTNVPTPAFTKTPVINIGIEIIFSINNSVNITDDAQFGINPISPAIIGPKMKLLLITFEIVSSPTRFITQFIINVVTNINKNIFAECFIADFTIPSS